MSADTIDVRLQEEYGRCVALAGGTGNSVVAERERRLAAVLGEAAAEIVRLRGEVCSCPSGDGSLRWPCKAHPPESIAPAEAKAPAPAMPNGVEAARVLADFAETAPGRLPGRVQEAIATVRAANNRDAAGVCETCNGVGMVGGYTKDGPWGEDCPACTPAAVPAGEAVAPFGWAVVGPGGSMFIPNTHPNVADHLRALASSSVRVTEVYTTPQPAPVQAAAQEGEALPSDGAYMIVYDDQDMRPETFARNGARDAAMHRFEQISGNWNAHLYAKIRSNCRDVDVPDALAAHPSACELGADTFAVPRHYTENLLSAACLLELSGNGEDKREAAVLRNIAGLALQHRGDSRGGEG